VFECAQLPDISFGIAPIGTSYRHKRKKDGFLAKGF
jgi:hypothetical protein